MQQRLSIVSAEIHNNFNNQDRQTFPIKIKVIVKRATDVVSA